MKIILMNGGLGNQLFQYVFYRYIQLVTEDICFIDDSAFLGGDVEHNGFEIEKIFGLKCNLLSDFVGHEAWKEMMRERSKGISIPQQLVNSNVDILLIAETTDYNFNGKVLEKFNDNDIENKYLNIYYHGYWLNKKWFDKIKSILIKELKFNDIIDAQNLMYLEYICKNNSVALHIRRGDFVKLGLDLNFSYYFEAINKMESIVRDAVYFIFSDDLIWCKNNFSKLGFEKIKNRIIFVNGNMGEKAYIDMQLMANCKNMILANSSFSSFASLLNNNEDKIIVIPDMKKRGV